MPAKEPSKRCGNCKFADKRNGVGNWSCGSPKAHGDSGALPPYFPRVFANDKCRNWAPDPAEVGVRA